MPDVGGRLAWSRAGVFVTEGPVGSGIIEIRDGVTGASVLSFQGHDGDVNDVAFSSDGSRLATTGDDGTLKVWDPSTGQLVSSMSGDVAASGPSFSADDSLVAAAWFEASEVRVLDLSRIGWSRRYVWEVRRTPRSVLTGAPSPWRGGTPKLKRMAPCST